MSQAKAASGNSILNTRVLTDAEGKETEAKGPTLDESFLKSLTRNFTFNIYARAGFQFNGSGGNGNFNFEIPDFPGGGRFRLGNENDFYTEISLNQAHLLGDSPDVVDASFRITPVFTNDVTKHDWYYLDTSGFGVGAYNIHLGPGNLYLARLGSGDDNLDVVNTPDQINSVGNLFKQTFDIRYRNIDIGFGKLMVHPYFQAAEIPSKIRRPTERVKSLSGMRQTVSPWISGRIGTRLITAFGAGASTPKRTRSLLRQRQAISLASVCGRSTG